MSEEENKPQQHNSGQGSVQVTGDGNFILHLDPTLTSLAESQMQAAFYQATGIYCSKEARIDLESLLDDHGFTVRELKRVWNSGAMSHNRQADAFEFHSRGLDLMIGWLGWLVLSMGLWVYGTDYIDQAFQTHVMRSAAFMVGLVAYAAGLSLFFYAFIWPQRIATRVRHAVLDEAVTGLNGQDLPAAA